MLNPRALAYLNEVIRRGSLRRAAAHLNIDPSAISRQLKQLEEDLGVRVCERYGGGMRTTAAGKLLVQHFHAQRSAEEAVLSQLVALQGVARGEVRIAVGEGFIADLIDAPMNAFMNAFPGIEVEIRMAGVNEAMSLLKDSEVDLPLSYPIMSEARAQIVSLDGRELSVAAQTCLTHLSRGMRFFRDDAPRLLAEQA